MPSRNLDRRLYPPAALDNSSRRSLYSESGSEVGSLLSGLSQARKIPDRRRLHPEANPETTNGKGHGLRRHNPRSTMTADCLDTENSKTPTRSRERPSSRDNNNTNNTTKIMHNNKNHEIYNKEITKIILMQAFARGYIARLLYKSRLTMEQTKKKFFAIQIQAHVRGFLQRRRFEQTTGKQAATIVKRKKQGHNNNHKTIKSGQRACSTGLGSPKQDMRRLRSAPNALNKNNNNNNNNNNKHMGSDSERSEISIRMLASQRISQSHPIDRLGESESEVGSIISNLSVARKVPDRRRKIQEKESKVVKIQAIARGYIQRVLYRSLLALENTKKKYAAITIQAYIRGHLQRCKTPQISRKHVAPRKELLPVGPPTHKNSKEKDERSSSDSQERKQKTTKKSRRKDGRRIPSHANHIAALRGKDSNNLHKNNRKPVRHRSGSGGADLLPRELTIRKPTRHHSDSEESANVPLKQLTIRKPRRHHSDSDDESTNVPLRQLTIKKPRRHQSDSEGSDNQPPKRVTVRGKSNGRNGDRIPYFVEQQSPQRKIMVRTKRQPRKQDSDMEGSEQSTDKPKQIKPRERLMSLGGASDSRFGESESDVGSLMSGLSQARKVPDRRQKGLKTLRNKPEFRRTHTREDAKTKSAIKVQAIARGYIERFAFKSRLIMEQTKQKFFAIQIQALARGFCVRSRIAKENQKKLLIKK